jgi:type VI secretion system protein ImpC
MTHDLPVHAVIGDHGDADCKGPAEVALNERREWELARLGFLPLCNLKGTGSAAFFCAQTAHRPRTYEQPAATADAVIAARLPCVMASSRFMHYLKVICRDRLGAFMERADVEGWLNHWISRYVGGGTDPDPETNARFPLREAHLSVMEIPGAPGHYRLVAHLRPWLPQGELTAPVRIAADLPSLMG